MGNRLSKIYTRTGDEGITGLGDGTRIEKDHQRIEAMGALDGLNAHIGLLRAYLDHDLADEELSTIQHKLFDIGGELALPNFQALGYVAVTDDDIVVLEQWLDTHNAKLAYLKEFILPAGSVATAQCHIARSYCRDVERRLVAFKKTQAIINTNTLAYINRLSDYLFVLARVIVRKDNGVEVLWQRH